jgi:hypothetical protein
MDQCFLRRRAAANYLQAKYGFGSYATLCKGVVTGDSPEYRKAGKIVLYTKEALDAWALSKLSAPVGSTSEADSARRQEATHDEC